MNTPGPWCVDGENPFEIMSDQPQVMHHVATVTRIEDANLIAYAPDMLALLKRVGELYECEGWSKCTTCLVRSLVAKVEGRI